MTRPGSDLPASIDVPQGRLAGRSGVVIECVHQTLGYRSERPGDWHSLYYCLFSAANTFKVSGRSGADGPFRHNWSCLVPAGNGVGWRAGGLSSRLVIRFTPAFLAEGRELLELPARAPGEMPPRHDPGLEHYVGLLLQEFRVRKVLSDVFFEAFSRMLQTYLCDEPSIIYPAASARGTRLSLATLRSYVARNIGGTISVKDLAHHAGLSYYQFIRELKREYGLTPKQLIQQTRIERAKALLVDSNALISDIALDTGFSSQSHFTNAFRDSVGCPPGEYRARHAGPGGA